MSCKDWSANPSTLSFQVGLIILASSNTAQRDGCQVVAGCALGWHLEHVYGVVTGLDELRLVQEGVPYFGRVDLVRREPCAPVTVLGCPRHGGSSSGRVGHAPGVGSPAGSGWAVRCWGWGHGDPSWRLGSRVAMVALARMVESFRENPPCSHARVEVLVPWPRSLQSSLPSWW